MLSVVLLGSCTILVPAIGTPIEVIIKRKKGIKNIEVNESKTTYKKVLQGNISHEEYMNNKFKTKDDVIKEYGAPTKKEAISNTEIWYYNLGETTTSKSKINIYEGLFYSSNGSLKKTTSTFKSYVEFQFKNGEDTVNNWRTNGVDYSKKGEKIKVPVEVDVVKKIKVPGEVVKVKVWPKLLKYTAIGFGIDFLILLSL